MLQCISPLRLIEQLVAYNVEERYLCYPDSYEEMFLEEYNDEVIDETDITQLRVIIKEIEDNNS